MPKRNRPRVKARLTSNATPRKYTRCTKQIFRNGAPPRTPASRCLTRWTVHRKILGGPLSSRRGDASCFGKRLSPLSHRTKYNTKSHGRLHSASRPRGDPNEIAEAGYLAEPIPELRDHHAASGIHFRVPQDRHARLWHDHHPIHAAQGVHRAQGSQDVPPRLSRSRHLLRKRREQNSS